MSEMMKSLRSGADRAAFEAGKLMRLQRLQLEQRSHEKQRRDCVAQLGEAVWQLYAQGRVSDPDLVTLCHQVQSATHEIAQVQKEMDKVREEQQSKADTAHFCLDCGHALRPGAVFCGHCGQSQAKSSAL